MNYFYYSIGILILLPCVDILIVLFRLRWSGMVRLFRHAVLGSELRRVADYLPNTPGRRNVLIVGDSTAVGPGTEQKNTLAGLIASTYKYNVTNIAKNGATTRDVQDQLSTVIESGTADQFFLIIICVGNNDIWRFTGLNKLEVDFEQLLDRAKSMSQKVIIFRGGNLGSLPLFPKFIGWFLSARSKKVRCLFMSLAEHKGVFYIEKYMERKEDSFLKDPKTYYCWDLLHLNECGHKALFQYFQQEVKNLGVEVEKKL